MSFYELIGKLNDLEKKIDGNERWLSTSQATADQWKYGVSSG